MVNLDYQYWYVPRIFFALRTYRTIAASANFANQDYHGYLMWCLLASACSRAYLVLDDQLWFSYYQSARYATPWLKLSFHFVVIENQIWGSAASFLINRSDYRVNAEAGLSSVLTVQLSYETFWDRFTLAAWGDELNKT